MEKKYDIEKYKRKGFHLFSRNKEHYILWLNISTPGGIGSIKIFEGTKYQCEKYAKENNIDLKKTIRN